MWKKEGWVGKLIRAMYGIALMWQKVGREKMKALGLHSCGTAPRVYLLSGRDVFVVAHVDDVLCSGEPGAFAWAKSELDKSLVLMSPVTGPGSFATYLGRQISWDEDGVSF